MAASMSDPSEHPHWLLRRGDQIAVAALVVVVLLAMLGWWAVHGGWSGRLSDIDHAEPLAQHFEVDVNVAECPELMQLPGIGPTLAEAIIESRKTNGRFAAPNDLLRVRGIGHKKLEQMRPYLRFGPNDAVASPD
jgi:competence protein ComEA